MKLTKIQLEKIRVHLDEIGFKYVEVQMEILDHVASVVEEKMTENPSLTFQDAVNQTQASFGKTGFISIEKSIEIGLSKKYWGLFLKHFISFFGIRYIWMFFLSVFGLYLLQNLISHQYNFLILFTINFIAFLFVSIYKSLKYSDDKKAVTYKILGRYAWQISLIFIIAFLAVNQSLKNILINLNIGYLFAGILFVLFAVHFIRLKKKNAVAIKDKYIDDKKYMSYKTSRKYNKNIGIILLTILMSIKEPFTSILFGLNIGYLTASILITFFVLYYIAALKTERAGILESKAIADKLNLLYN